ncbi:MAG: hypothetical protein H6692_05730 [Gemmatimonadales bacterium]|nr:hypothetical protein [Gemmatimonadales bacterium]
MIARSTTAAALLLLPALLTGQSARLGEITFPTSATVPAAQAAFEQGVLWMHSFEYDHAAEAFRRAQQAEPGFAMAYWGEAMTHNHPIWNERAADSARAILARLGPTAEARSARASTPRERAWLASAEVLWGEGPKPRRDSLYLDAMRALATRYPDDEADAFLSLAWLGLSQGVRDIPSYMRGGKIALDLFARAPRHPGAAHYVIHAFDDPDHAILALDAARAYSGIAPDAGHAQHMTTHIFLALGMWDDVARQNVVAMQAARGNSDSLDWAPGHYTWWLHYARLQQGKWHDAREWLLRQQQLLPADAPAWRRAFLQRMVDEWQVNIGLFDQVPSHLATDAQRTATGILTRGLGAGPAHRAPTAALRRLADELTAWRAAHPDSIEGQLLEPQLRALVLLRDGHVDSAVALLRATVALEAAQPVDFGPPAIVRPAHEALAELLLEAGRLAEARTAYERALARTPGRARLLAGLVLATEGADDAHAAAARAALARVHHGADPGATETLLKRVAGKR